eukprot:CAMPEP_0119471774 /NCGR_PEP_ID=MMETSP1344-20130328/4103_1 /TAXON_ID=236787 /ORGANISM="Florenciella parvula, Strain CCMP2471" /LENGTH=1031 /DNA_ID=CAMNT_0007504605 /DNA_START=167 /DNA_END=3263 /DNA_ORIENTATION=+
MPSRTAILALELAAAAWWTCAAAQSTHAASCPDDESHGTPWKLGPSGGCYKVIKAGMYGRCSASMCAEDVCAPMGGALADVPDEDTSAFLARLMGRAEVGGAYFGMYQPPDADPIRLEEGWTWASGYNGTYRQWVLGAPSNAYERCGAMLHAYNGDWEDTTCGKCSYVNGCVCQHGKASTSAFVSFLPELEDQETIEGASDLLSAAATCVLFALVLSYAVPWLLRRALKPFVRHVATTLCGTRPVGAEEWGSEGDIGGGAHGYGAGKTIIPQFAIALGNGLDSAAAASRVFAAVALLAVLYLLFSSVQLMLLSAIDLGGDPLDAALAYIEYTAVVLGSALIAVIAAYGAHLAEALPGLWRGWQQRNLDLQPQPQTQVHPVPSAPNSTGAAATAGVATAGAEAWPSTSGEAEAVAEAEAAAAALAEAMLPEPTAAFRARLRHVTKQIIVGIASGAWGSADEREAILAGAGLALDAVVGGNGTFSARIVSVFEGGGGGGGGDSLSGRFSGRFSGRKLSVSRRSSHPAVGLVAPAQSPEALATGLQTLLMRFPLEHAAMGKVLAEVGLRWVDPPRRSTPGRLDKWNRRWKDVTAGTADSSLFTASGVWVSPDPVVMMFGASGLVIILLFHDGFVTDPLNVVYASMMLISVACICLAVLLVRGDRAGAKRFTLVTAAVPLVLGFGILTPALGAAGPLSPGVTALGWGGATILVGLVYKPRRSFYLLYGGFTATLSLAAIMMFAELDTTPLASLLAFLGTAALLKRHTALAQASVLVVEDAEAYEALWRAKLGAPGAGASLAALGAAWAEYMAAAVKEPKRQPESFGSVEVLFNACDRLNPVMLATLRALCAAQDGDFHAAAIKGEDRALQKVHRSYNGDFRRLTELVRCSLCFTSFDQIAACLRAIVAHPDIVVLSMKKSKMRFDAEYDAVAKSGGYRDVQIAVRIDSEWTRAQGLDKIWCEVQLHDAEYYHRKTTGGGHGAYVLFRNKLGSEAGGAGAGWTRTSDSSSRAVEVPGSKAVVVPMGGRLYVEGGRL